MRFEEFAEYLEKLEETGSRLAMTETLAELLGEAGTDEVRMIAYMAQGKLGPAYKAPDFGMADKQVMKAIARLTDEDVNKLFKEEGDLGGVVEMIKHQATKSNVQDIETVFEKLMEVAKASGEGSQEAKIALLTDLLNEVDGRSAKYIVKIVLGKLRTGFSDMTVLDALSWMITGGKGLRKEIEAIYNVRADLGEVAEMIKSKTLNSKIQNIKVEPEWGTPVLLARAERSTGPADVWKRIGPGIAEHKLDGLRLEGHVRKCQAPSTNNQKMEVKLFSRGLEDVTMMYPDVVKGLEEQVEDECILDGEMIAVGSDGKYMPFQETVQRKRKYDIEEMLSKVPLKYYVFDILMKNGEGLLEKTNSQRREILEKTVKNGGVVRLMPRVEVRSEMEIERFFNQALDLGTEGIMVKKTESTYQAGNRNFNWIKLKSELDTVDCLVMGYSEGEGKRASFGIGEFLVGIYDEKKDKFLTISKVGSGATDEGFVELRKKLEKLVVHQKPDEYQVDKIYTCDYWVSPEVVVELKANELTVSPTHSAGYALRFPRLVAIREKKPKDATSLDEIERIYKTQKK